MQRLLWLWVVQYSISKEKVIGEISDSKDCVFRIIVNDGYSSAQTSEKTGSIKRFRFVSPTYQLLSSVVDSGKLTLQYKVIDIGFDGSINQIAKNSGSFLKLISTLLQRSFCQPLSCATVAKSVMATFLSKMPILVQ